MFNLKSKPEPAATPDGFFDPETKELWFTYNGHAACLEFWEGSGLVLYIDSDENSAEDLDNDMGVPVRIKEIVLEQI